MGNRAARERRQQLEQRQAVLGQVNNKKDGNKRAGRENKKGNGISTRLVDSTPGSRQGPRDRVPPLSTLMEVTKVATDAIESLDLDLRKSMAAIWAMQRSVNHQHTGVVD